MRATLAQTAGQPLSKSVGVLRPSTPTRDLGNNRKAFLLPRQNANAGQLAAAGAPPTHEPHEVAAAPERQRLLPAKNACINAY